MIRILPLSAADPVQVEQLLDAAFGTDRHGRTAYRLREGTSALPELSFAAFDGDQLVGTLQSWPIQLIDASGHGEPIILVGPVAVQPDRQRAGIGVALMNAMLERADISGADALTLIGDPEYYGRLFGFAADETAGWDVPGPVERRRLLARLSGDRLRNRKGMLGPQPHVASALR